MKAFLQRFGTFVLGVLCGFDRMRFRGSKRLLCHPGGLFHFLCQVQVLVKDYKPYAKATTTALCKAIETDAKERGLYRYLNNSQESKEETALNLAKAHGRTQGLIAVIGCVEPCRIMQVRGNRESKLLEPVMEPGKCLHYYHYYLDADFGLRYTRLQSWFPFTMHMGLNGRDWLAQQMTNLGLPFVKQDNCFTWVEDWELAQRLLDEQLTTNWSALLDRWAEQSHPWLATLLPSPVPYYWSLQEGEFATDIAFNRAEDLASLYPRLVHWATMILQNAEVLRFFGHRRLTKSGKPHGNWDGEIITTIKQLVEGTCVKHRLLDNMLKMYDKFGQVLRLENLLIHVREFKVFRQSEGDSAGPMKYLPLRKGVADIHRRAELGQKINDRYAAALATVEDKTPLAELTHDLVKPTTWKGRRVRALNPLAPQDLALLEAVNHGEFLLNGFRNRDLRALLFATEPATPADAKRQSSKVTRQIRLLRAHGLIKKVTQSHRYTVTDKGHQAITALLAARQADTKNLLQAA